MLSPSPGLPSPGLRVPRPSVPRPSSSGLHTALTELPSLVNIGLEHNEIYDLSPLVDNEGIGLGDGLNITGNPIHCEEAETLAQIQTLIDRGVRLADYYCPAEASAP